MCFDFHRKPINADQQTLLLGKWKTTHLPLMLMLTRLAVGLEPLSVPGAFAPLAPFRPGGIGSPADHARAWPFSRQRTLLKLVHRVGKASPSRSGISAMYN